MSNSSTTPTSHVNNDGATVALLRVLHQANVKFIRFCALDLGGNMRCKVVPVDYLLKKQKDHVGHNLSREPLLLQGVAFVKVSIGGMPSYGDVMLEDSGLTAYGTLRLRPDLSTLRILPYDQDSAIFFGSLHEDDDVSTPSDLCCRSLLRQIVDKAKTDRNISFSVGVELEFVLFDATTNLPIDHSNFADTTLLNRKTKFVSDVYDTLSQQEVAVELFHAESAFGQMELVLEYSLDPVRMADNVVLARETIRCTAHQHGMKAVFLPKVFETQAGNGCHIHLSLRNASSGENVFASIADNFTTNAATSFVDHNVMSIVGQHFVEGILCHLPSLMAVTMPTTNSFRRVGPGCWTGSQAVWAVDDKEAPVRVVADHMMHGKNSRLEFKLCDSTSNIYMGLSMIILAGLDGISKSLTLRPTRSVAPNSSADFMLPSTIDESLDHFKLNKVLTDAIPSSMLKGYVAIRLAEVKELSGLTLADDLRLALQKA
jgi:glutamine synthetase